MFRDIEIVIIKTFVVVASVGIKGIDYWTNNLSKYVIESNVQDNIQRIAYKMV